MQTLEEIIKLYDSNKAKYLEEISLYEKTIIDVPELYRRDQLINKISHEKQLGLMCCGEHEFRAQTVIENLMNGLTNEEVNLLKEVNTKISENNFNWSQRIVPKSSIIRHLYQRRLFKNNFDKNLYILEIGPGSGYLGIFLQKLGHTVLSHEIYQPYYMYQYWLYKCFNIINETCVDEKFSIIENKINHLPWQHYFKIAMIKDIKIDVVIINNAFCEINKYARAYLLKIIKEKNCKLFMEHLGSKSLLSHRDAIKILRENGLICKKKGNSRKEGENFYIFEKKNIIEKNLTNKNIIKKFFLKIINIFELNKTINYFQDISSNITNELLFLFNKSINKKIKNQYNSDDIENIYINNKWNNFSVNEEFLNKLK